ncbi:MAG: PAS domain S-box protein [Deltaproteobacteria bacterium]|nr:PAS domain S-box protein [Deltaproteobacteria bacterium]
MPVIYITALSFIAAAASVLLALALGVASDNAWAVLPLCALSLLMLAASAYLIIRKALWPIDKTNEALERIEAGDYRGAVDIASDGPFGALAGRLRRLMDSLDESAARRGELLETMPDLVMDIDRTGNVAYFNEAAARLTGYAEEDVLERPFLGLLDKRSTDEAREAFERVLDGEPVKDLELILTLKDGGVKLFEFNAVPVRRAGAAAICRVVGRDIDGRKEIIDELRKARAEAEESSEKLQQTVRDLEDFALLAVRREIKMHEIREMLHKLRKDMGVKKGPGAGASRDLARDIYRS